MTGKERVLYNTQYVDSLRKMKIARIFLFCYMHFDIQISYTNIYQYIIGTRCDLPGYANHRFAERLMNKRKSIDGLIVLQLFLICKMSTSHE